MDEQSGLGRETVEQRDVNTRLVLSALREQELVDRLSQQLAFTRAITDSLSEGVYTLDPAGRITFVNPTAARLLGWTQAELLDKNERDVIVVRRVDDAGATAASSSVDPDLICTRKDGTTFPMACTAAPIVTDGAQTGAVVVFRDMTVVRALERAREEYIALISHDLRTPLAVIQAHAQLLLRLLRREGLDRGVNNAEAILTGSRQIDTMLTNLLDQARFGSGRIELHPEPTDLAQLLARVVSQFAAAEEGAQISFDTAASLTVSADAEQLERVVNNVLSNARKYSPADSPAVVRLIRDGSDAVVSITDQGMGIAEADLPHLFEKSYRAEQVGAIQGLGLGLYSSRLIVEAHGGRLWAESAIGKGSTFRFSLPLNG